MFFTPNQMCYYEGRRLSDIKGKLVSVDKVLPSGLVVVNREGTGYLVKPSSLRPYTPKQGD